jgi:hypothetical protein
MRTTIIAFITCCLAAGGFTASEAFTPQAQRGKPLVVAIFRDDGVIAPFAQYSNRRWRNPWPNAYPQEPNTIADLSRPWYESHLKTPGRWHIWPPSQQGTLLTTSKSIQVCSHCQQVWGLKSNYAKTKPLEPYSCANNLGIALNGPARARAIDRVGQGSADWARLTNFVAARFDRAEAAGLAKIISHLYRSQIPPAAQRQKVRLMMRNLYRARLESGRTIFFFEANKEYARPSQSNDPGCPNISAFSGWIVSNGGRLTLLKSDFWSTDCDRKDGGPSQPYAILRLDGTDFAVVEEASYEGESYVILEIGQRRIRRVLETYAGSC